MKAIGHEGLNNLLVAYEDKSAKAVCTFGFSKGPGHEPILFQGITDVSEITCVENPETNPYHRARSCQLEALPTLVGIPSLSIKARHMPRWIP
jgi:hypothetical protein